MLMQLFLLSRFDVKSPCDNGTQRCWCFLSCVADMSGPVAKSINVVNAGLPSKSWPNLDGDPSTGQTTQQGPLFGVEQLSPQSGSSAPLKIRFSLLRALLPWDVGLQAVLHCTAGKPRQPPRVQTPVFLFSASCRPTRRHPAQQAHSLFICAHCRSAVFKVIHAVVVMSLHSLIYNIVRGQWLITITRALIDFHTTC